MTAIELLRRAKERPAFNAGSDSGNDYVAFAALLEQLEDLEARGWLSILFVKRENSTHFGHPVLATVRLTDLGEQTLLEAGE